MKPTSAMALLSSLLVSAACIACGGESAPPATAANAANTPGSHHGDHEKGGHDEHHKDLAPPVHAFHEALAPLWHMEKGADRTAKTCAQGAALREKATATGDKELVAATTSLVAECEKEGKPEFDARFTAVHERFHALAEKH